MTKPVKGGAALARVLFDEPDATPAVLQKLYRWVKKYPDMPVYEEDGQITARSEAALRAWDEERKSRRYQTRIGCTGPKKKTAPEPISTAPPKRGRPRNPLP